MNRFFCGLTLALIILVFFNNCHYVTAIMKYPPRDTDYLRLTSREISRSPEPFSFPRKLNPLMGKTRFLHQGHELDLQSFLTQTQTQAFLVIQNDTITYEAYFDGYDRSHRIMIWSVTKVFVSSLTQIAVQEGLIASVEDPIIAYLPELKDQILPEVKIKNLLNMDSGINYTEADFKLEPYLIVHYGKDLTKFAMKARSEIPPGRHFRYSQTDLILLALILRRSIGQPLYQYLEEKIWHPLGMEFDAFWAVDETEYSLERSASGLYATPEDVAKLGRLYLNQGRVGNTSILAESWINTCLWGEGMHPRPYMTNLWRHNNTALQDTNLTTIVPRDSLLHNWEMDAYAVGANSNKLLYLLPGKNLMILRFGKGMKNKKIKEAMADFASQL